MQAGRLRAETSTDLWENAAGRFMTALRAVCRLLVDSVDKVPDERVEALY
jgi:hypothetical protein